MVDVNQLDYKESLEEQVKDAINILQLLEVDLSANEDDENIIRTVTIVKKMLKEHLNNLQQLSYCENNQ